MTPFGVQSCPLRAARKSNGQGSLVDLGWGQAWTPIGGRTPRRFTGATRPSGTERQHGTLPRPNPTAAAHPAAGPLRSLPGSRPRVSRRRPRRQLPGAPARSLQLRGATPRKPGCPIIAPTWKSSSRPTGSFRFSTSTQTKPNPLTHVHSTKRTSLTANDPDLFKCQRQFRSRCFASGGRHPQRLRHPRRRFLELQRRPEGRSTSGRSSRAVANRLLNRTATPNAGAFEISTLEFRSACPLKLSWLSVWLSISDGTTLGKNKGPVTP